MQPRPIQERRFQEMQSQLAEVIGENERISESLADMMLAAENIGWAPLGPGYNDLTGPNIGLLSNNVKGLRNMLIGNPLAKRAYRARTGYIWRNGIIVDNGSKVGAQKKTGGVPTILANNARAIFSQNAHEELEAAACTDGNVFFLCTKSTKKVLRVPLAQITATVSDPDSDEIITHYRRTWTRTTVSANAPTTERLEAWYPADDYTDKALKTIDGIPVDNTKAVVHAAFNRQTGWQLGIPDLFSSMWWIKSYKEYMEAGWSVTKALAKFALKSKNATRGGANQVATAVKAYSPTVPDGLPGYGNLAALFGQSDISTISKSGADFNFDSGKPIAALIAAGMEISVDVLLAQAAGGQSGEVSLDEATVTAMIGRQNIWDEALTRICRYFGVTNPQLKFPPVRTVPVHRAIQAVSVAAATNVLYPDEVRGLALQLLGEYGIDDLHGGKPPEDGAWQKFLGTPTLGVGLPGQDPEHPGTSPLNTPNADGGKDSNKSGAGSIDDTGHDARKDKK